MYAFYLQQVSHLHLQWYNGVSAKFSTSWNETDYSALPIKNTAKQNFKKKGQDVGLIFYMVTQTHADFVEWRSIQDFQ